ncbi:nuclease-related domain-containing protein [Yimella sp. RIT 621]|uniref:nuclease-related domain-containing protein n=1 Tax=Yimella sp. RIT 621 TaxID=2510323 RepID=UPI001F118198|nr:nuclease-related domain-containing protein [Yimella sp. RIT 621]
MLHDRRIPCTRTNIDHLVVTTAGVWVIDAKRYKGRLEVRVEGGILRRVERLIVGRRDCTALVDGALDQAAIVRDLVGDLRVVCALCFVDADWPLVGGAFSTRGVHVLWPKRLVKLLRDDLLGEAPLTTTDVARMRGVLAAALPPA